MSLATYDYIVVGAGAAGCALASRLAEVKDNRVLLLEYGPRALNPLLRIPMGFFFTLRGERYVYKYKTRPVASTGESESWQRGKVMGGSTAVNGMMYLRGAKADFDDLEASVGPGWGWDTFLAAYRDMEDHSLGPSEVRGSGGPLGVSVNQNRDPLNQAIIQAGADSQGWSVVDDLNEADTERIGFTPSTIKNGLRVSAFDAFIRSQGHRRLEVRTGTQAVRLLFDGRRVTGVRAARGRKSLDYHARSEVILCCGAVETPLLLERSGIGHPEVLRRAGVALKVEAPSVGEAVIEQRSVGMQVRLSKRAGSTELINSPVKQLRQGIRYLATRRGPVGTQPLEVTCQFKSSPDLERPDVQLVFAPIALDPSETNGYKLADHSGIVMLGWPIRPTTQSSIHLTGPSPSDPPEITSRFLEDAQERSSTGSILRVAREVLFSAPLAEYHPVEQFPGPETQSADDTVEWARRHGAGIYHAVGSAKMGSSDGDVVDHELRVRGVDGLRVADLSVLPFQVSGNTQAPAMAIGWIAGRLIEPD